MKLPFGVDTRISLDRIITWILLLVVGAVVYMNRIDSTQSDMKQFRVDIVAQVAAIKTDLTAQAAAQRVDLMAQIAQLQASNDRQFNMVRGDIANIPGMKERVDQLDKRMDQADSRFDAQSRRLEELHGEVAKDGADIVNILRIVGGVKLK